MSASAAAYCHRKLNKIHQQPSELAEIAVITDENQPLLHHHQKRLTVASVLAAPNLPHWAKISIQLGATFFGGLASVAGVRACRNAMLANYSIPFVDSALLRFLLKLF